MASTTVKRVITDSSKERRNMAQIVRFLQTGENPKIGKDARSNFVKKLKEASSNFKMESCLPRVREMEEVRFVLQLFEFFITPCFSRTIFDIRYM